MKKAIKLAIAAVAVMCATSAFAQQPKFGRINLQEVVTLMPERTEAQLKLQKLNDDYASMIDTMQVELNRKYQEYQKNMSSYSESIRQIKEREMQDLQTRIEEYYRTANSELEKSSNELFEPILKKAEDAVKKVGRDNGYLIIFDESTRPMAYYNETNLTDVLPMVKKELGIKDAPTTATPKK